MKLTIRGDKLVVTVAIKSYIEEKLAKLDKYFETPDDLSANIVVRTRGIEQIIEVTIPIKKAILRAEESNKDLYAAIDKVADKLERSIRKNKTKIKKRKVEAMDVFLDFEIEEEPEQKIVKRKTVDNKPMSEEEAILQMELLDHDFFIFNNTETNNACVIYKRKDNSYGLIEIV